LLHQSASDATLMLEQLSALGIGAVRLGQDDAALLKDLLEQVDAGQKTDTGQLLADLTRPGVTVSVRSRSDRPGLLVAGGPPEV
jgi:hypothetical protein